MPKLNVQQNNQNVIQAFKNALAIGNLKGIIASDGSHNFSTAGSNRNLLDNPWFTVNQRSAGSTSDGYPADRWLKVGNTAATATATANGLVIALNGSGYCDLRNRYSEAEIITPNLGKTATISIMLADGTVFSDQIVLSTTQQNRYLNSGKIRFDLSVSGGVYLMRLVLYDDMTIRAVKLELGSVSTLANDVPPDYGEELRKCQRYFTRWYSTAGSSAIGLALAVGTTNANFAMLSNLRAEGSATISFTGLVLSDGTDKTVTNVSVAGAGDGKSMRLLVTSSGLTAYRSYVLQITAGGHLDVSKDL